MARSRVGRLAAPALLFVAVVAAYLANGRTIGSGDTLPARYLPWSVLAYHRLDLDPFPGLYDDAARRTFPLLDGIPYYLRRERGHYLSAYAPGAGALAVPVYAAAMALGVRAGAGWDAGLEKLSAALITALSVVVLHAALARLVAPGWALAIALIYAFGTSSWSVSSQALWQHGPSQLFLALVLYGLVRGEREPAILAASGLAMSAAVVMRSTDVLLVAPVVAWIALTRPALIPRLVLWSLPPAVVLIAYQLASFGAALGGSGHTVVPTWALFSQTPLAAGVIGVLLSPGRGLFVYSPVLLFALAGMVLVWRRGPWAFRALSLGPPLVAAAVGKWFYWWGGHSWGPRLLADTTPILCFFLYPLAAILARRPMLRALFIGLALVSVGTNAVGAILYDGRWDALAATEQSDAALWSWRHGPLAFYVREAVSGVRGHVRPAADGVPTSADAPELLAASYQAGAIPRRVVSGQPMPLPITLTNTGRAVWLASAPGERGAARLGWRWECCDKAGPSGRAGLPADIAPGEAVSLTVPIAAPTPPGEYTLVVDMVSEFVTWFAERGSRPVTAKVTVSAPELSRLLSGPLLSAGPVPAVAVATDRRAYRVGDPLELAVTLAYPHRPRSYDAYLLLQGPAGTDFVYDGQRLAAASETPWATWVKRLPLPAQATGRFVVPLGDLSPGEYRWSAVLTGVGTYDVAARASTPFRVTASGA